MISFYRRVNCKISITDFSWKAEKNLTRAKFAITYLNSHGADVLDEKFCREKKMVVQKRKRTIFIRWMIYILLSLTWMAVIFNFSSKTSDESSAQSNAVGMFVGEMVNPGFEEWPEVKQEEFADKWDYPIRKAAHMTEYMILGILLAGTFAYTATSNYKKISVPAFMTAVLYAITDEIHQYFVPGRACRLYDVGFDSAGALIGVLIGTALIIWWNKKLMKSEFFS